MLGGPREREAYYLRTRDFDYELPPECVAAQPTGRRDESRLLVLDRGIGMVNHAAFRALPHFLRPHSLLILNDTRVIPARLRGTKITGGAVEVLLVRSIDRRLEADGTWHEDWETLAKGIGGLPEGARLEFGRELTAELRRHGSRGATELRFTGPVGTSVLEVAERIGAIPLPPYVEATRKRQGASSTDDRDRYQTVYARVPGAVAAPTAGLHFTEALLSEIAAAGHEVCRLTLHVGPGTFRPVETEDPRAHEMDVERYDVPADTVAAIERARASKRPIVAVGTTVVRALESAAAAHGTVPCGPGETKLFLLPGATFRVVTDLVTNFHLPRSTLLMLVSAFAGHERVMSAYREAIRAGYRFYSYGDAMFIRGGSV